MAALHTVADIDARIHRLSEDNRLLRSLIALDGFGIRRVQHREHIGSLSRNESEIRTLFIRKRSMLNDLIWTRDRTEQRARERDWTALLIAWKRERLAAREASPENQADTMRAAVRERHQALLFGRKISDTIISDIGG